MMFRLISIALLVMVLLVPMNGAEAKQEGSVPADHYLEADFVLELDSKTWAKLYLSETDLGEAIGSKAVTLKKGNKDALVKVFAMFDRFQPAKNVTILSLDDMTHMVR